MNSVCKIGVVAALAALAGCGMFGGAEDNRPMGPNGERLNRIPGVEAIDIPSELSDSQALDAVEQAINGTNPGERTNRWLSQWRPEMRDSDNRWIRVGLTARGHYLCVCYRIEGQQLIPDVPTSTNLKQDGIKIHRKVPSWINGLRPLIQTRMYGIANGSSCIGTKAETRNRTMQAKAREAEARAVEAESRATMSASETEKAVGASFCPYCGNKVAHEGLFCAHCGKKLKQ